MVVSSAMERRIAREFHSKVQMVLPDEEDRDRLYTVLRNYQSTFDLDRLLYELRLVVDTPEKLPLYDDIRPLIPLKHQISFDRLAPHRPTRKLRVIRLSRKPGDSLGFSVRGGLEHGTGIFVSSIQSDSLAFRKGLRIGDEIVRLNGFTISQAIHDEFLQLIRAQTEIILKVKQIGMLPFRERVSDSVSWRYVERSDSDRVGSVSGDAASQDVRLFINMAGAHSLGCSICSGPPELPGIFIQSIKVGGLAEEAGLQVGDQLLAVNNTDFTNIKHSERTKAVVALKSSRQLSITLRKAAGLSLFAQNGSAETLSAYMEQEKHLQIRQLLLDKDRVHRSDKERRILDEESRRKESLVRPPVSPPGSEPTSPEKRPDSRLSSSDSDDTLAHHTFQVPANIEPRPKSLPPGGARPSVDQRRHRSQSPVKRTIPGGIMVVEEESDADLTSQDSDGFDPVKYLTDEQLLGRDVFCTVIKPDSKHRLGLVSGSGRLLLHTAPELLQTGNRRARVGDEVLMINDHVVEGLPVVRAQSLLDEAVRLKNRVRLVLAKPKPDHTSFDSQSSQEVRVPISDLDAVLGEYDSDGAHMYDFDGAHIMSAKHYIDSSEEDDYTTLL